MKKIYRFSMEEIHNCNECPLHDGEICKLLGKPTRKTVHVRPKECPLKEQNPKQAQEKKLPCPCGHNVIDRFYNPFLDEYYFQCPKCRMKGKGHPMVAGATRLWNERVRRRLDGAEHEET